MKRFSALLFALSVFFGLHSEYLTVVKAHYEPAGFTPYYLLSEVAIGKSQTRMSGDGILASVPFEDGRTYFLSTFRTERMPDSGEKTVYADFNAKFYIYSVPAGEISRKTDSEIVNLSFKHPASVSYSVPPVSAPAYSGNIGLLDSLTSGISSDSLYRTVAQLSGAIPYESGTYAHTRLMVRPWLDSAAVYLEGRLAALGLDSVYMQPFNVSGYDVKNVVGYKKGSLPSDMCVVIGAHYDDYSNNFDIAPGADDNASGSAGVLEAARALAGFDNEYDIYFVLFTAEEYGLYGSEYFVYDYLLPESIDCIGMVNFDMIGYDPSNDNRVDMYGVSASAPLKNLFSEIADTLTPLTTVMLGSSGGSDHYFFEMAGFKACFAIENNFSPVYHTTKDSIDILNFTFMKHIVRAGTATLAQIASMPLSATILDLADNGDSSVFLSWQQPVNTDIESYVVCYRQSGDADYTSIDAGSTDSATVSGLTPGVLYYFYVSAVDSMGFQSFPSQLDTVTPSFIPNSIALLDITPSGDRIEIIFSSSRASDFQNYNVYRRKKGAAGFTKIASVFDTLYTDSLVPDTSVYEYEVSVSDTDGYESPMSNSLFSRVIALSNGLLVIDETLNTASLTDEMTDEFYSLMMGKYIYDKFDADSTDKVDITHFGNYSAVLYIDDDLSGNKLNFKDFYSYIENGGTFIFAGWNIGKEIFGSPASYPAVSSPGSDVHDVLHLDSYDRNAAFDMDYFSYSDGDTSFNAYWDTTKLQRSSGGKLIYGGIFESASGMNENFALYHSASSNTAFDSKPLIVSADDSSFTLINVPLYYMHLKDARFIVSYFLEREGILSGVDNENQYAARSIKMNPLSRGGLELLLNGFTGEKVDVEIIDKCGRVVYSKGISVKSISFRAKVDSSLSSGIYFVRVRGNGFEKTDKIAVFK